MIAAKRRVGAQPEPPSPSARRSRQELISDLRELVAALDRRVPRLEREGERRIARDSAMLKQKAQQRIAELERE